MLHIDKPRLWIFAVAAIALLHLAMSLAPTLYQVAVYPDEDIAQAVSGRIWRHRTVDTNWRHAPEVARLYPGDQFNFSSAILAAQPLAYVAARLRHAEPFDLPSLRFASAVYGAAALVVFFLSFRRMLGPAAALLSVLLAATSSQLFLESAYARPEAFVLFAFAVALYAALRTGDSRGGACIAWAAVTGFFCGLLVAAKFSLLFVPLHMGAVVLAMSFGRIGESRRPAAGNAMSIAVLAVATLPGFAVGAPYAAMDPAAFVNGTHALLTQYGGAHLPYGRPFSPTSERLAYALSPIIAVNGVPQLVLGGAGAAWFMARRPWLGTALIVPALVFVLYFSTRPVYFERNFSHYLPLLHAFCAYAIVSLARRIGGSHRQLAMSVGAIALAAVLIAPVRMLYRMAVEVIPEQRAWNASVTRRQAALAGNSGLPFDPSTTFLTPPQVAHFAETGAAQPPAIYRLLDLADPFSAQAARMLVHEHGWQLLGNIPSPVADLEQPLLPLAFAQGYRYVAPPDAHVEMGDAFAAFESMCALPGAAPPRRATVAGGPYPDVAAPDNVKNVWGSWAGSDAATGALTLGPFVPPEGSYVALVTGPGVQGITGEVREAASGRILSQLPRVPLTGWVAWRMPRTLQPVVIDLRDEGTGWGQWIAAGTTLFSYCGPAHARIRDLG